MEACRACDGNGKVTKRTRLGVEESASACGRCSGSGHEPKPSKGGKRRCLPKPQEDEADQSIEAQTRAFLAKHGY